MPPTEKRAEPVIRGYRSGYLPQERRAIERGLRQGQVRVVVATNALELGIDIGDLQAALLVGYPGTIAATWQQSGRAGRGESASLAVLVATADPLDQFLASHPNYLFERSPEHALINPDNPLILLHHLRCSAFELPFVEGEGFEALDPDTTSEYLEVLRERRELHHSGSKYFWIADQYPAQGLSLRSAAAQPVLLQAADEFGDFHTIGQVDRSSALWLTHPQAVYLHESQIYLVEDLDLELGTAHLTAAEVDYYTLPSQPDNRPALPAELLSKDRWRVEGLRRIARYNPGEWLPQDSLAHERDSGFWRAGTATYRTAYNRILAGFG